MPLLAGRSCRPEHRREDGAERLATRQDPVLRASARQRGETAAIAARCRGDGVFRPEINVAQFVVEEENFILNRLEVQQITLACVTLLLRLCILTTWLR